MLILFVLNKQFAFFFLNSNVYNVVEIVKNSFNHIFARKFLKHWYKIKSLKTQLVDK